MDTRNGDRAPEAPRRSSPYVWLAIAAIGLVAAAGFGLWRARVAHANEARAAVIGARMDNNALAAGGSQQASNTPSSNGSAPSTSESKPSQSAINSSSSETFVADVRVQDEKGGPIPGATLELAATFGSRKSATDAGGEARLLNLPRTESIDLQAHKEGRQPVTARIPQPLPSETAARLDLVLLPEERFAEGVFMGKVTDKGGKPIGGAFVRWRALNDYSGPDFSRAVTKEDGTYRLDAKLAGPNLVILAQANGHTHTLIKDQVPGTAAAPRQLDIALAEGHWLNLTVEDDTGRPIEGASAYLFQPEGHGGRFPIVPLPDLPESASRTDANGEIRFESLPSLIHIMVSAAGYVRKSRYPGSFGLDDMEQVDRDVTVVMMKTGVVKGRVVDAKTRQPIREFTVRVPAVTSAVRQVHSDAGVFSADSLDPQNKVEIVVDSPGYSRAVKKDIELIAGVAEPGAYLPEILFELERGAPIRAAVVDGATRKPVAGAVVRYGPSLYQSIVVAQEDWNANRNALRAMQETLSGVDGSFEFIESTPAGAIFVEAPGYADAIATSAQRAELTGADGLLRIPLQPEASISGIYVEEGKSLAGRELRLTPKEKTTLGGVPVDLRIPARRTGPTGAYAWETLGAGSYWLGEWRISGVRAFMPYKRTVDLAVGEAKIVNLSEGLGTHRIFGTVYRKEDEPVGDVMIRLEPKFVWEYASLTTYADAWGKYELLGLAPGAYSAEVSKPSAHDRVMGFTLRETIEVGAEERHDFLPRVNRTVTARLIFPPDYPAEFRALNSRVMLISESKAPVNSSSWLPTDLPMTNVTGKVEEDGRVSFSGRFRGPYSLAIPYEWNPVQTLRTRGIIEIDAWDRDVDLGDIAVSQFGFFRVKMEGDIAAEIKQRRIAVVLTSAPGGRDRLELESNINDNSRVFGPYPVGDYELRVGTPGFASEPKSVSLKILAGREAEAVFTTRIACDISGMVEPMGVRIRRLALTGMGLSIDKTPNPDDWMSGIIDFDDLPPGQYELIVEADNYKPWKETFTPVPGAVTRKDVKLEAY